MKNIIEKYKNMSFSEAAESIGKKWKNKDTDLIEKNSYSQELEALAAYQEKKRVVSQMTEAVKQFKKGGLLPKYSPGGLLNGDPIKPDGLGQDEFNIMNPSVPPTLASINPLDNPVVPQVNNMGAYNPVKLTVGERIGKAFSGLTSNPTSKQTENREMSAYAPALIGQGVSTALNLGILAGGYDKVSPVDNPYESQVIRNMADRGIDTTQQRNQILSAYNAAKENIGNTRSANVNTALNTNLLNLTQDNLAESKLQEQQINNQYKSDYSNVLGNLGQAKAQARIYSEDATARNKAAFENSLSQFGDLMAQHGESFSAFKANQNMNTALAQLLNDKYASTNLGISQDMVNKFNSGKATEQDWIELKSKIKEANPNMVIPDFKLQ